MYEGIEETLISEKFYQSPTNKICTYVYRKILNGELGFNTDDLAIKFVKELLNQRCTVLFPSLLMIDSPEKIEKNINMLRGITFLEKRELIEFEHNKYLEYESNNKKNALLARYKKPINHLEIPVILTWYDSKARKYTKEFMHYCESNDIEFIVWAYSDWGIYFFSFNNVNSEVKNIANALNIPFVQVDNVVKMPYY